MREIDPMQTGRAESWSLYHRAPMPMVTILKTLDITNLMDVKQKGYRLNMLLCYCIGLAAEETPQFRLLPVGDKMIEYDRIGLNVIVKCRDGSIHPCDIPFSSELAAFNRDYCTLTEQVRETCEDYEIGDSMIVGTSSLVKYEIDGVINMYSGIFNNPFVIWGRYREEGERTLLSVSFQFHHVQMDGMEACEFLERLQEKISGTGHFQFGTG